MCCKEQIINSIGMRLTLVPAGEFMMGSSESAEETAFFFRDRFGDESYMAELFDDEHPRHRVRITNAFYLGIYHVTRGQFGRFVEDIGYVTDAEKGEKRWGAGWNAENCEFDVGSDYSWRETGFEQTDEHPVVNVSWNDAVAFCDWLSLKEREQYRLPTEAEWEYACRAGTTTRYWSGDDPETLAAVANVPSAAARAKFPQCKWAIQGDCGYVFTAPVGSFRPNAFGLFDMHGNACQLCSDRYAEDYYATTPPDDPTGPIAGSSRVARGGSWASCPDATRCAARFHVTRDFRADSIGFRVCVTCKNR
jgi:formylglycine-generating enzyme required for sulfatase activity